MVSGMQPLMRIHGDLVRIKYKELSHKELKQILFEILDPEQRKYFEEKGDLDFAYELPDVARYRANFFVTIQRKKIKNSKKKT
jgi:twitching motility protein PilT